MGDFCSDDKIEFWATGHSGLFSIDEDDDFRMMVVNLPDIVEGVEDTDGDGILIDKFDFRN